MKVRYSLFARAELLEIIEYIEKRNPKAAAKVLQQTRVIVDLLRQFPLRGRKQRQSGVRKLGAGKYPYSIYYHVDKEAREIVILNIRHAARRQKHRDA